MNISKQRIKEFYRANSRKIWLLAIFVGIFIGASHAAFLYSVPLGKVTKVTTKSDGANANYGTDSTTTEERYAQTLTIRLLNTKDKGKTIKLKNSYSKSLIDTEKYRRSDQVILSLPKSGGLDGAVIKSPRRDNYALGLVLLLVYLLLVVGRKRGALTLASLAVNAAIFVFSLRFYARGEKISLVSLVMVACFTVITLFLVNGVNKRSAAAIIATFLAAAVTLGVFLAAKKWGTEIDYAALDYITGDLDFDAIFLASISLAGLGAIMDVGVSIAATINELIEKDPDISYRSLLRSGRAVGHDIMGTMTNVLLFTYVCGLIPLTLIKLKNEISLISIIRLQIPFEVCRFLIGGIGIVIAIPISIGISLLLLKTFRRKGK